MQQTEPTDSCRARIQEKPKSDWMILETQRGGGWEGRARNKAVHGRETQYCNCKLLMEAKKSPGVRSSIYTLFRHLDLSCHENFTLLAYGVMWSAHFNPTIWLDNGGNGCFWTRGKIKYWELGKPTTRIAKIRWRKTDGFNASQWNLRTLVKSVRSLGMILFLVPNQIVKAEGKPREGASELDFYRF